MSNVLHTTHGNATILEVLPNEILCQIFEYLPVMWRIVCRSVCQRWRHLLLTMPIKRFWFHFAVEAAGGGHLEVLKWARNQGCPWNARTCANAAEKGHLEVLQWARSQGCPWDELTCAWAALKGHLEVLQWARSRGCAWDEDTCAFAAHGGHLEVLQWARSQGYPWNERTCAYAARGGHLDMLKWARSQEARAVPGMSGHVRMLPVDVCLCCSREPFGSAAVGAKPRLSLE